MVLKGIQIIEGVITRPQPQMFRSDDVIPGCSQRGLSPFRIDQAAPKTPQHAAPLKQHDVNHQWTAESICGWFVCIVKKQRGRRRPMEVHVRASSNPFGIKTYWFSLISISSDQAKRFFCSSFLLNLINVALKKKEEKKRHSWLDFYLIFGGYLGYEKHSSSWVKGEQTWLRS